MKTNIYHRELTEQEIASQAHRTMVGGLWEEMGKLQFDFLRQEGLEPGMNFLDVGCGALRGGIHFIAYLDPNHYYGMDVNESLLEAGYKRELPPALRARLPRRNLLLDAHFDCARFGQSFDYGMAQSVFSHLPLNHIRLCLVQLAKCFKPGGRFYATFFEAPADHPLEQPLAHQPGGVTSYTDQDPYHYRVEDFAWCAAGAGWRMQYIGDWNHPRAQRMLCFARA